MIVPSYWAEARLRRHVGKQQVTLRRFGWSDLSHDDAQRLADERVAAAMARVEAGERLERREPKVAYNGAEGVPIREEILARHGTSVVTRNSYGAHCLNVPDVLFADVDFGDAVPPHLARLRSFGGWALAALAALALWWHQGWLLMPLLVAGIALQIAARAKHRSWLASVDGAERAARDRVAAFAAVHVDWALRVYRTPAGLRLLATHRPFLPDEPATREFFEAVGADPAYVAMCVRQQCFRARLTAKPWRIGISHGMRPRPGIWPIAPERAAVRADWVRQYESAAQNWAACRFVEAVGSGAVHIDVDAVRRLHDEACRATSSLPVA